MGRQNFKQLPRMDQDISLRVFREKRNQLVNRANIKCACEECTIAAEKISNSYQECVPRYKLMGKRKSIGKYNQLGKFIRKLLKRGKKVTKATHFKFTYLEAPHKRMPHCKIKFSKIQNNLLSTCEINKQSNKVMKEKIEKQKRKQQE